MPLSELSAQLRNADPNFKYAPLIRIEWNRFSIFIGDHSIGLGCNMPYAGWKLFKPAILEIITKSGAAGIISTVERFSLKYIDIVTGDLGHPMAIVDLDLKVGPLETDESSKFQIRTEFTKENIIHIIQLASSAIFTPLTGSPKEGVVIDIDSIVETKDIPFNLFVEQLPKQIELLHTRNKEVFFSCLKEQALAKLEPVYD